MLHGTGEFQPQCSPVLCPLNFFLRHELETQLFQYPALANPAELGALLTRVYHGTWTGSGWIFEQMGKAWVRRLMASVAARRCFFFRVGQMEQTASYRSVPLKDTAQFHFEKKRTKMDPEAHCFNERVANGGNSVKMKRHVLINVMVFRDIHFSPSEKNILRYKCVKQHTWLIDPWSVFSHRAPENPF